MNSLNAAAIGSNKPGNNSSFDSVPRKVKQSTASNLNNEGHTPKVRKRSCAIDSPSDLIIDEKKDELLSISHETKNIKNMSSIEEKNETNKNKKRNKPKYSISSSNFIRYLYDTKGLFNHALEVFNRLQCHKFQGGWKTHGPFFECKGAIRVSQRMCTRCRDVDKLITRTDLYYVDMTERIKERTVLCHGCLGIILKRYIGSNENQILDALKYYRKAQKTGIVVIGR